MDSPIDEARPILERLAHEGEVAFIVGGAVRDYLLEKPIHDIDIATSALPEKVLSMFENTVPVGLEHGTVLVIHKGKGYEVTTFRSEEGYKDFRHPDHVSFHKDILVDLSRRDFTINAMAMGLDGALVDPFHGEDDLNKRQLVTVGLASQRFQEDPLRMLRAARFVSQLEVTPSLELTRAMNEQASLIQHISIERVRDELTKCLRGVSPYKGLKLMVETGLSSSINGLRPLEKTIEQFKACRFDYLESDAERWTLLFYLQKTNVTSESLQPFRFSKKRTQEMLRLAHFIQNESIESLTPWILYNYGADVVMAVDRLRRALGQASLKTKIEALIAQLPIHSRDELRVTGHELMHWTGQPGGPWVGEILQALENAVICGEVPHQTEAMRRWVDKWMKKNKLS